MTIWGESNELLGEVPPLFTFLYMTSLVEAWLWSSLMVR